MPKFEKITTSFNSGELSPKLAVRNDIEQFKSGCKQAKNIELLAQGGFKRRGGFKYKSNLIFIEEPSDLDFIFDSFEIREDLIFQIVFYKSGEKINIQLLENGQAVNGFEYFDNTGLNVDFDIKKIKLTQNVNNLILTHPEVPVKKIELVNESPRAFLITEVEFINTPQIAYFDDLSPPRETEEQSLYISLFNLTGNSDGDVTSVTSFYRDYKFAFNSEISEEIQYRSQFAVGVVGNDSHFVVEDHSDDFITTQYSFTTSDIDEELELILKNNSTGYKLNCGFIKRSDYLDDVEFVEEIVRLFNEKFHEKFCYNFPYNNIDITTPVFSVDIINGGFVNGDLTFDFINKNLTTTTNTYLSVSNFELLVNNQNSNIVIDSLSDKKTFDNQIGFHNAFSKFGFFKDFESNFKTMLVDVNELQRQVDISNDSNNNIRGCGISINFIIGGSDSLSYSKISGEFTEPKIWQFENTNIIGYVYSSGDSGEEDAWSQTRGYPSSCGFIENRLVFGGSKSLPNFLWASKLGEFYNFSNTDNLNNEAILNVSASSTKLSDIKYLTGEKTLQVFSEGGEYYNPNALTPSTISLPLQSKQGIANIPPVIIDNATYFINKNRDTLRRFLYDDNEQAYKAQNVSILSSHLIKKPIDMTAYQNSDSNFIVIVKEDNNITVHQTIREQNISGYFEWESNVLNFVAVTESGGKLYAIGKYDDSSNIKKYGIFEYTNDSALDFEVLNSDPLIVFTDEKAINQYSCIAKENNEVIHVVNNKTTQAELSIETEIDGLLLYKGIDFTPTVETTSISVNFGTGEKMSKKKRINECYLHLNYTTGWHLTYKQKEYKIDYRSLPISLNSVPDKFTGDKRVKMLGYIDNDTITITQEQPFNTGEVIGLTITIKV